MRSLRLLAALVLAALPALSARSTTLVPLSPQQVDSLAHRIVEGRIVAAHDVQVTGTEITAIEYELAIDGVEKDDGSVAEAMTRHNGILLIRQIGSLHGDQGSVNVSGMPRYVIGARYRLALAGDSSLGLTSPMGFGQGVRRLSDDAPKAKAVTP